MYAWLINTFTLSDDMTNKTKKEDNDDSLTKALAGESSLEDVDNDTSLVTVISYDKIKDFKPDLSDFNQCA